MRQYCRFINCRYLNKTTLLVHQCRYLNKTTLLVHQCRYLLEETLLAHQWGKFMCQPCWFIVEDLVTKMKWITKQGTLTLMDWSQWRCTAFGCICYFSQLEIPHHPMMRPNHIKTLSLYDQIMSSNTGTQRPTVIRDHSLNQCNALNDFNAPTKLSESHWNEFWPMKFTWI